MDIPWEEQATVVRTGRGYNESDDSEMLFEGPLIIVAAAIRKLSVTERQRLRVSFPNRRVPPYSVQGAPLKQLLDGIPAAYF